MKGQREGRGGGSFFNAEIYCRFWTFKQGFLSIEFEIIYNMIDQKWGGGGPGSKAIWNFPENSSVLEAQPVPKEVLFSYFHHRPDHLTWIAPKLCDRWDWIRFRGHLRAPLVLVIFLYSTHLASLLSIIMPNVKMSYQHTCPTCYLLRHERAFSSPITTMKISFFQTWYLPRHGPASFTLLHQLLPQHLPEVRSFFFSLTQGGRSWQPFGEGKNGHEDFCQARKCKFANSTQYNM